jgi:thiamine monophosphate synthase
MALGELTKQLAQQALLSATSDKPAEAAKSAVENPAGVVLGQIAGMQKALKEDEELLVTVQSGSERIRVMEIFMPSPHVVVLSGVDAERNRTRVISGVEALQLVCKVVKAPAGAKGTRIGLVAPK